MSSSKDLPSKTQNQTSSKQNTSDSYLHDLKMKYLPELADDSEIRKNRELIEDLRANLR
jgi:hypothetical protein